MDIRPTDALLVIDPQNDFCEGGVVIKLDGQVYAW